MPLTRRSQDQFVYVSLWLSTNKKANASLKGRRFYRLTRRWAGETLAVLSSQGVFVIVGR